MFFKPERRQQHGTEDSEESVPGKVEAEIPGTFISFHLISSSFHLQFIFNSSSIHPRFILDSSSIHLRFIFDSSSIHLQFIFSSLPFTSVPALDVVGPVRDCHTHSKDQSVRTTPQRTRFRDVQHSRIMATVRVDDDKTKSDHNIKKKTWNFVCVVKPNDETSDTNDNVKTKTNTEHMKRDLTSECARSLLVSSCCVCVCHTHSLHTTSRSSSCPRVCLVSSMHEVSVTLRL